MPAHPSSQLSVYWSVGAEARESRRAQPAPGLLASRAAGQFFGLPRRQMPVQLEMPRARTTTADRPSLSATAPTTTSVIFTFQRLHKEPRAAIISYRRADARSCLPSAAERGRLARRMERGR